VTWLDDVRAALEPAGLNQLGVIGRDRYDASAPPELRARNVHPGARSIVVVGSGGRAHWERFLEWVAADPVGRLARRPHPLDDFCAEVFAGLDRLWEGCRVVFPTFRAPLRLDFVKLGELAGLGRRSEQILILVGDRFGPWLALRAAVFAPHELPESTLPRHLCTGCPAPCLQAVAPAGIVDSASHLRACESCIVAPAEIYLPLQRMYHYDRAAGRRALCALYGVADEVAA